MILRIGRAAVLAAAVGSFIGSADVAAKTYNTVEPCTAEFDAVGIAIDDALFLGNKADADRNNLLGKLTAAEAKAAEGKTADAIAKLSDIAGTANALANAQKPKLEDASAIEASVDQAIACLSGN